MGIRGEERRAHMTAGGQTVVVFAEFLFGERVVTT